MSDFSSASCSIVQRRGELLRCLRQFFYDHGFTEVETPLVSREIIPERHIEPMRLEAGEFLQASPEAHMKRLLTAGAGPIFQVTRSFRAEERGRLHNPEFTIVEWYRPGDDMAAGIALLDELCQTLLSTPPATRTSYAAAFESRLGINPHTCTVDELQAAAQSASIDLPTGLDCSDRDAWLNLLLAFRIEPELGQSAPEVIFDYPANQASLAKLRTDPSNITLAERFELYWRGTELANGFHELTDAEELRERLVQTNHARIVDGHAALPLPEELLAAMQAGLPHSTGCALGFDRLVMLAVGATSIDEVLAFPSVLAPHS